MIFEPIVIFIILFRISSGVWADESFFDVDEQHDFQVPLLPNPDHVSGSKTIIRQKLIGKLLSSVKEQRQSASENSKNNLISGPEMLEIRELLFDDRYKPWGAAALPSDNHNQHVILDKIDDELFTPNSERHSYDERKHEEARTRLVL